MAQALWEAEARQASGRVDSSLLAPVALLTQTPKQAAELRIRAAHLKRHFKVIEGPSPVAEWSPAFHERRRGLGIGE
jgi:hypothetical protein